MPTGESGFMDFNTYNAIMNIKEKVAINEIEQNYKEYELIESSPDLANHRFVYKFKVER